MFQMLRISHLLSCLFVALVPASAEQSVDDPLAKFLRDENGAISRAALGFLGQDSGNRLFYLPTRDQPATPAKWNFKYEDIHFKSSDGTDLHGWLMPARGKSPLGTVVFSHGNAGSIGHHLGLVMWLVEAGYNVFMYDYRGFGKSGGSVDRRGMLNDVQAAFSHISSRNDIDSTRIISYGHSLGGAKSITAIAEKPVRGLRAMVIDGTFSSYRSMARKVAGDLGANLITDDYSPIDFIGKVQTTPILVVHGNRDEVVPLEQGKQLYQLANEPKTLFEVEGGTHGDSLARNSGAYRRKMIAWLAESLK